MQKRSELRRSATFCVFGPKKSQNRRSVQNTQNGRSVFGSVSNFGNFVHRRTQNLRRITESVRRRPSLAPKIICPEEHRFCAEGHTFSTDPSAAYRLWDHHFAKIQVFWTFGGAYVPCLVSDNRVFCRYMRFLRQASVCRARLKTGVDVVSIPGVLFLLIVLRFRGSASPTREFRYFSFFWCLCRFCACLRSIFFCGSYRKRKRSPDLELRFLVRLWAFCFF